MALVRRLFDAFGASGFEGVFILILLALPQSARASEFSQTDVVRVVLTDGDTLQAARVRPAPFDMVAVEMSDSQIRYLPSNRVRAVLDSRGVDHTKALLEQRETIASPLDLEANGRGEFSGEDRTSQRRIHALTWRGRPLAETPSFMITEFGVLARLDDYPYIGGDSRVAVSFDLGWMKNISEHGAVGFSGYALVSDPTTRLGIRARYRRWLSRKTSIDVSPGVLLGGEDSAIEYDPPGFVLGATVNAGDLVALTVDAEYARNVALVHDTPPLQWAKKTDVAWRAGAKLGSGLGLLGAAGLFGLVLLHRSERRVRLSMLFTSEKMGVGAVT
ncbi:MAG: hypothetical protein ACM3PF_11725 [Bacteroidota bacterium]